MAFVRRSLAAGVLAAFLGSLVSAQQPSQAPGAPSADDPVQTLVARLDLEKYRATIKGLTDRKSVV